MGSPEKFFSFSNCILNYHISNLEVKNADLHIHLLRILIYSLQYNLYPLLNNHYLNKYYIVSLQGNPYIF